jgi:hypothetical protein
VWFYNNHGELPLPSYIQYLVAAADTELAAVGVPAVGGELRAEDLGGALARFGAPDWEIEVDSSMIRGADMKLSASWIKPSTAAFLAGGIYHEARHAEQAFPGLTPARDVA